MHHGHVELQIATERSQSYVKFLTLLYSFPDEHDKNCMEMSGSTGTVYALSQSPGPSPPQVYLRCIVLTHDYPHRNRSHINTRQRRITSPQTGPPKPKEPISTAITPAIAVLGTVDLTARFHLLSKRKIE